MLSLVQVILQYSFLHFNPMLSEYSRHIVQWYLDMMWCSIKVYQITILPLDFFSICYLIS